MLIGIGVFTMIESSKDPIWDMSPGFKYDKVLEEVTMFSTGESTLIISDCKDIPLNLKFVGFLGIVNSFKSDSIDIIYAKNDIPDIKRKINSKSYKNVFAIYSSIELLSNLKLQLGDRMTEQDYGNSVWRID